MAEQCRELQLTASEKSLLDTSDAEVEKWLEAAQGGQEKERESLLIWACLTARDYYCGRVASELWLTPDDAEDLAMQFLEEFESALPTMRSANAFIRGVRKRKLDRFLGEKKERVGCERPGGDQNPERSSAPAGTVESEHEWDDEQWEQYQLTLQLLYEADEITRAIIEHAFGDPPLQYEQIAEALGTTPGAARMRVWRFYQKVRQQYREKKRAP